MNIFKPHKTFDYIAPHLPDAPTILEVGAFSGRDTVTMATRWPQGVIHAFEPVPEIFANLESTTAHLPNVHRHHIALSDTIGMATFYVAERSTQPGKATQAGSLHEPQATFTDTSMIFPRTAAVQTTTLDAWAKEQNIQNIDLLWLDTQGHELAIVQAAPHMLAHTAVIFTEVSFVQRYEGQPSYQEVVSWLQEHGFQVIGRDFEDESAVPFGNILCIRT